MPLPTLVADTFTRPFVDLADVQARIKTVLGYVDSRLTRRAVPADLALHLTCARDTLVDMAKVRGPAARAKAFRAEFGVETMKSLWFAVSDHAGLLGLRVA